MLKKALIILLSLHSFLALSAFEPADYAKEDSVFYAQIENYENFTKSLRTFYLNIRKNPGSDMEYQAGDIEWQMFQKKLKEEIGVNLLNIKDVRNLGIDINQPIGLAVSVDNEKQNGNVYIWIPARNSYQLYQNIKKIVKDLDQKRRNKMKQAGNDISSLQPSFKEIKRNSILMSSDGGMYIAKHSGYILLTSDKGYAINPKKNGNALSSTVKYQKIRKNYPRKSQEGIFIIDYSLIADTALGQSAYMYGNMTNKIEKKYMEELKNNLISMGGSLNIKPKELSLQFSYFYKEGYLQDKSKMMPKLLMNNTPPLTIDYYSAIPILYFTLKVNLPELFNLMIEMEPTISQSITEINNDFSQDTGLDLKKDVIDSITGRASMILTGLPPESEMENFNSYKGYLSFGIRKGSYQKFYKILNVIKDKNSEDNLKIHSTKLSSNMSLWVFETTMQSTDETAPVKKNNIYLLLKDTEIIISPGKDEWIQEKQSGINLVKRIINKSKANTSGFLYVNINSIVQYMKTTSYGMMLNMYLEYFKNMKDIYIYSSTETNKSISNFVLRLK